MIQVYKKVVSQLLYSYTMLSSSVKNCHKRLGKDPKLNHVRIKQSSPSYFVQNFKIALHNSDEAIIPLASLKKQICILIHFIAVSRTFTKYQTCLAGLHLPRTKPHSRGGYWDKVC